MNNFHFAYKLRIAVVQRQLLLRSIFGGAKIVYNFTKIRLNLELKGPANMKTNMEVKFYELYKSLE